MLEMIKLEIKKVENEIFEKFSSKEIEILIDEIMNRDDSLDSKDPLISLENEGMVKIVESPLNTTSYKDLGEMIMLHKFDQKSFHIPQKSFENHSFDILPDMNILFRVQLNTENPNFHFVDLVSYDYKENRELQKLPLDNSQLDYGNKGNCYAFIVDDTNNQAIKILVFSKNSNLACYVVFDTETKTMKKNYKIFNITTKNNSSMKYSVKYRYFIFLTYSSFGVSLFDMDSLEYKGNILGFENVLAADFYDEDKLILVDQYKIHLYNFVNDFHTNVNNEENIMIYDVLINKTNNELISAGENGSIYIYRLDINQKQFAIFHKIIKIHENNCITALKLLSPSSIFIVNSQKYLTLVNLNNEEMHKKNIKLSTGELKGIKIDLKTKTLILRQGYNENSLFMIMR